MNLVVEEAIPKGDDSSGRVLIPSAVATLRVVLSWPSFHLDGDVVGWTANVKALH